MHRLGNIQTKLKEKRLGNGEEYEKMTNDQRLNWISEIMKEAMKEANGKGKGRKKNGKKLMKEKKKKGKERTVTTREERGIL